MWGFLLRRLCCMVKWNAELQAWNGIENILVVVSLAKCNEIKMN